MSIIRISPIKEIYFKVQSMIEEWNTVNNAGYIKIIFQEANGILEQNLYFSITEVSKHPTANFYDIRGMLYKDIDVKNNKNFNFIYFDVINNDDGSYLQTNNAGTYTLEDYGDTSTHTRTIVMGYTGRVRPTVEEAGNIKEVTFTTQEIL